MAKTMKVRQLHELLYQALETEKGGILVYETALRCVQHDQLREEWEEYLEQTRNHEIAIDFVRQDALQAGFSQVSMRDPFTTRANGHDDMWMLVLRPDGAARVEDRT